MTGYIIGLLIGVLIFLAQNLKPASVWFRISFLLFTAVFLWGISYIHAGYWNILIIPIGVIVLCFIAAMSFPYSAVSAQSEYMAVNGRNYYAELKDEDKIGKINAPGFKQTYDRIISGILSNIVNGQDELQRFGNLLYSKNFYPISTHTKKEIMQHINSVIDEASHMSKYGKSIDRKAKSSIEILFNAYVSVMSIHEEATNAIEINK